MHLWARGPWLSHQRRIRYTAVLITLRFKDMTTANKAELHSFCNAKARAADRRV
jgi:hypothetical protein